MPIPFLSQTLADSDAAITVPSYGLWHQEDATVTGRIAKSTATTGVALEDLAQSMPGVWGYARFFHTAWSKPDHPYHATVVELWRRFVCLVALRERLIGRPLTLVPINLPVPQINSATDAVSISTFRDAAALQFPHEILGTDPGSSVKITAVRCENQSVGLLLPGLQALPGRVMLSPLTCPGVLRPHFPLSRLDDLSATDRVDFYVEHFSVPRLQDLADYLLSAADGARELRDSAPLNGDSLSTLHDRLRSFQADIQAGAGGYAARGWAARLDDALHRDSLFRFSPAAGGRLPRALLPIRAELPELRQKVDLVLVTGNVSDTAYRGLAVRGSTLVGDLTNAAVKPADREAFFEGHKPILIISEADLFEPTLVRFSPAAQATTPIGLDNRFLIPLTPLALLMFGPDTLRKQLSIRDGSDSEATVVLRVAVGEVNPIEVELMHTYNRQTGSLIDAGSPECLAIWPDFAISPNPSHDGATPTLVYQNLTNATQFRAARLLSRRALVEQVDALLGQRERHGQPPRLLPTDRQTGAFDMMGDHAHELLYGGEPAEAIHCNLGHAAGLLLIDARKVPHNLDTASACTISIDFGTSSTTLALRVYGKSKESNLQPHVWMPFADADIEAVLSRPPSERQAIAAYLAAAFNFVPPVREIAVPFPSMLQVRGGIPDERAEPMLRCCIPFPSEITTDNVAEMIRNPTRGTGIALDLKWGIDGDKRLLVRHLLREVMLLALGQARGLGVPTSQITWRLSLPRLMPSKLERRFRKDADEAYETVMGQKPSPTSLKFHWESVAIYAYLLRHAPRAAAPVMALLDIGGRSTDIAILDSARRGGSFAREGMPTLKMDGSADLAGRALLVEHWAINWNEFQELLQQASEAGPRIKTAEFTDKTNRTGLVELLLNDAAFKLSDFIRPDTAAGHSKLLAQTRQRLQFGYLGLMYFVIFHGLGYLCRDRAFDASRPVGVFLCGRGSRLVQMFCIDDVTRDGLFRQRMENWLRMVGFTDPNLVVTITDDPKMEVAIGGLDCPDIEPERNSAESQVRQTRRPNGQAASADPSSRPTANGRSAGASLPDAASPRRPAGAAPPRQASYVPLKDGHGTIDAFCREVQDLFPLDMTNVQALGRIKGSTEQYMANLDLFPGFTGFAPGPSDPFSDPRRRFIIDLKAVLDRWAELVPSP